MKIIACVDENLGLMFHHRRQSQDRIVRERIKTIPMKLYMNQYSYQLYQDLFDEAIVDEKFMDIAKDNDYCLIENVSIDCKDIDEVILFYWNREYPADFYLNIDLNQFVIVSQEEFAGSSHDLITQVIYRKE